MIKAYAAETPAGELKPIEYEPQELGVDHVEVQVDYCGICHSDLSMLNNDWQMTAYPFVPGHEVVGRVSALGSNVSNLQIGQKVGIGWFSESCMMCADCLSGDHNLCASAEGILVGRHGGFADKVRCHKVWATPLPNELDPASSGPLFCGGITVYNPIVQNGITANSHVAVIGIGGLGHMALSFLNAWGCEVTAFSTTPDKEAEAKKLGAHHFINSKDQDSLEKLSGQFDLILDTINVDLPWDLYMGMLKPKGKLHIVGAAAEVKATIFPMILGQKSIGGSPLGSPATTAEMLSFSARHNIAPMVEEFPMSQVNEAMEKLKSGRPRYRLVLKNDF